MANQKKHPVPGRYKLKRKPKEWKDGNGRTISEMITHSTKFSGFTVFIPNAAKQEKPIKILHPSGDGTWVEFHGMSARQKDVLNQIKKDARQNSRTGKNKASR